MKHTFTRLAAMLIILAFTHVNAAEGDNARDIAQVVHALIRGEKIEDLKKFNYTLDGYGKGLLSFGKKDDITFFEGNAKGAHAVIGISDSSYEYAYRERIQNGNYKLIDAKRRELPNGLPAIVPVFEETNKKKSGSFLDF